MVAPTCLPLFDRPPTLDEIQADMIDAIVAERKAGKASTILEAATGTGKTICTAKYVRRGIDEWDARCLFVVDEDKLVKQAEEKFARWGLKVAVEQGPRRARDAMALYGGIDVTVATRQTLHEKRLESDEWNPGRFTDVMIDECHVGFRGKSIRKILGRVRPQFVLGLSATPFFADGKPMVPDYFESTAFVYPLKDYRDGRPGAVTNGHLVPPMCVELAAGVDLRGLKAKATVNGKDYSVGDLEDRISGAVETLTNAARMEIARLGIRRALHFTPDVRSARAIAGAYDRIGLRARAIHGDLPQWEKDAIFGLYHQGGLDVLVGCQMFLKGFDDPPTDGLIMGRPTLSLSLAWQMLGRGTRTSPDTGKTCCHVIGFSWQVDGKGPVSTLDLFLEDDPDQRTREIAKRLARVSKGPVDVMKVAEQARVMRAEEIEEEKQREHRKAAERLRISARKRDVSYRRREVDLLGRRGKAARLQIFDGPPVPGMATPAQRAELAAMGIDRLGPVSESEAAAMTRRWSGRVEAGMSSYKQCSYLQWLGVPMAESMQMSAKEASVEIGRRKQGRA